MKTSAHAIAQFLGVRACDANVPIFGASSLGNPQPRTVSFAGAWDSAAFEIVRSNPETVFLISEDVEDAPPNTLPVPKPRQAYARVARQFFVAPSIVGQHVNSTVSTDAVLGADVTVHPYAVIEAGVVVGDRCDIGSHSVLHTGTQLGSDVKIASHTAIGHAGFGFELEADGTPVRIPHVGGVVVGDRVEIGSHVTIAAGTIEPTTLGEDVKIDDAVFIAHNVKIGRASFIIAGAEISGSVIVGERVWISPQVAIINQVSIGDDALVGIGAVVLSDVLENTIVAGVPAKPRGLRFPPQ